MTFDVEDIKRLFENTKEKNKMIFFVLVLGLNMKRNHQLPLIKK